MIPGAHSAKYLSWANPSFITSFCSTSFTCWMSCPLEMSRAPNQLLRGVALGILGILGMVGSGGELVLVVVCEEVVSTGLLLM